MCFIYFAGFQTTQTQGYDWNRLNLTGVSERLESLGILGIRGKLKESFEFQNASLKEYDKFSLPSERSVIKTLNDDTRQSYGFVLVAIWSRVESCTTHNSTQLFTCVWHVCCIWKPKYDMCGVVCELCTHRKNMCVKVVYFQNHTIAVIYVWS